MLALPPSDPKLYEECKNGVVHVAPMSIPREYFKKGGRKNKSSGSDDSDDEQKEMDSKFHDEWEKKRKKKSSKENDTDMLLANDHYSVLGIEDLGITATDANIKGAYRKLALQYHPDKHKREGKRLDEIDEKELTPDEKVRKEIWLKIQKAYEILMDSDKRKKFDGSLPFDESLPKEDAVNDENFYDVFDEVFKRNALWAKKKPVPNIGSAKTAYKTVEKFYRYWNNFETTRDFSHHDEYDLEEAQDGYEKRYMDKENKKIRKKYITKERARIYELYRVSYRNDPRIKEEKMRVDGEKGNQNFKY
jgi:DnaJ family protein C protein 2